MSVLYVLACGSPAACRLPVLVDLAQQRGWQVVVATSADGRRFVDRDELAARTGYPVLSGFEEITEHRLPSAHAIVVAPATVNTINKWAAGIADTLPLALAIEGVGRGLPVVALPFSNSAMAAFPAFADSIVRLRGWGVTVLYGEDIVPFGPPGNGQPFIDRIPWHRTLDALPAP
jgi:phosphopantothenoylcysteine synthetase/decarboxylase